MDRRMIAIAVAALLLLLTMPMAALLLVGRSVPPATSSPSTAASGSPTAEPGAGAVALDPRQMLWSFAQPQFENGIVGQAYSLQAGDLAAAVPIVEVEVPWVVRGEDPGRIPAIAAPAAGAVAFVADDGHRSQLHRVAIHRGANPELVADLEPIVWDLEVDPAGTTAYLAVLGRDGTDAGVLAVPLDGSAPPRPLMPPAIIGRGPDVGMRLAAILPFGARLGVSLDGLYLSRNICSEDGCRNDVIELSTGAIRDIGERQPIGIVGHILVHSACDLPSCRVMALDLRTGDERDVRVVERQAILLNRGPDAFVVVESDLHRDGRALAVSALALADGEETVLARAPEGGELSLLATHAFDSLRMALPPGLALVEIHGGEARRLAIDVVTGEQIEVRRPPIRLPGNMPQG